ncbi:hypothetical protein RS030_4508 [Cryptosporidium xiaoi]|uniref:Uncharacterized protein n=1 Tax=Cryptosporidium xiaoi TaxID=659607 RepID=A0AAV9Y1P3_9CRYT
MNIVNPKSNINYYSSDSTNDVVEDEETGEITVCENNISDKIDHCDERFVNFEVDNNSMNTYNRQLLLYRGQNNSNQLPIDVDGNSYGGGCTNGGNLNNCHMTPITEFLSQNNSSNVSINSEYYQSVSPYTNNKSISTAEATGEALSKTIKATETRSISVSTTNTVSSSPYSICVNGDDNAITKIDPNSRVPNFIDYSSEFYGAEKGQLCVTGGRSETFESKPFLPPASMPYYIVDQEINICTENSQNIKEVMYVNGNVKRKDGFESNIEYKTNNMNNYTNSICNNNGYCYVRVNSDINNANNLSYKNNINFNKQMIIGNYGTMLTSYANRQNVSVSGPNVPSTLPYLSIQNSNVNNINNSFTNGVDVASNELKFTSNNNNNIIIPDYNNIPTSNLYNAGNNIITSANNCHIINSNSISFTNNDNNIDNYYDNINYNANNNNNNNIGLVVNQGGNYYYGNNVLLPVCLEKQNNLCNFSQIGEQQQFQNLGYYQSNNSQLPNYWDNCEIIPSKTKTEGIEMIERGINTIDNKRHIRGTTNMQNGVKRTMGEFVLENVDSDMNADENQSNNNTILKKRKGKGTLRGTHKSRMTNEPVYDESQGIVSIKNHGMKFVGKSATGYISNINSMNVANDRNFYIVDFISEIPLNIRNLFMNIIKNTANGSNVLKNYSLGSLAMRRTGSSKPAIIKCFFNSYRDGISRLQSKTKRQEGRPFIFVINETKLSRPWVFCPNIKCIRRSKSSGKLKGRIKIYEYCPNNNKIILSPTFLKCARGFLTSDYYFCATLCPQQKYADHDSNFWGENFITGFGGNKIQEALEKDSESFSGSNSDISLIDYILFCNSKHQFVAIFKRYPRGSFKDINNSKQNLSFVDQINNRNDTSTSASTTPVSNLGVSTPNISDETTAFATPLACNSSHIPPITPCSQSSKYLNYCSNTVEEDVYGDEIELSLVKIMTSVIRNLEGSNEPIVYASTEKCLQEAVSVDDGIGSGIGGFQGNCIPIPLDIASKNMSSSGIGIGDDVGLGVGLNKCNVAIENDENNISEFNNYINNGNVINFSIENKQAIPQLNLQQIPQLHYQQAQQSNINASLYNNNPIIPDMNDGLNSRIVDLRHRLGENNNINSNINSEILGTGIDIDSIKNTEILNISNNIKSNVNNSTSITNSNSNQVNISPNSNSNYFVQYYNERDAQLTGSEVGIKSLSDCNINNNIYNKSDLVADDLNQYNLQQSPIEKSSQLIEEKMSQIGNNIIDDTQRNEIITDDVKEVGVVELENEKSFINKNNDEIAKIRKPTRNKNELGIVVGEVIKIGGDEKVNFNKIEIDVNNEKKKEQRLIGSDCFDVCQDPLTTTTESPNCIYFNSHYDQKTPTTNRLYYCGNINDNTIKNNVSNNNINGNIDYYDFSSSSNLSSNSSIGTMDMEDSYINNKYETYSTGYTDEDSNSNYNDCIGVTNTNNSDSQISFNFDPQDALLVESSTNWVLDILLNKNNNDNSNNSKESINNISANNENDHNYGNNFCRNCGIDCDCNSNDNNNDTYSTSHINKDKISHVNSSVEKNQLVLDSQSSPSSSQSHSNLNNANSNSSLA